MPQPDPLVYTVIATVPVHVVDAYVGWLLDGHAQAVVEGGAARATVTRMDAGDDASVARIESRYVFATAADFARYEATVAPGLRADGVATFVEPHGVRFSRWTGRLAGAFDAGEPALR